MMNEEIVTEAKTRSGPNRPAAAIGGGRFLVLDSLGIPPMGLEHRTVITGSRDSDHWITGQ